jgi:hypothetical protein
VSSSSLLRLAEHPIARAVLPIVALVVAALVILPRLSEPGLWEPHEMRIADDAVARAEKALQGDAVDAPAPLPPDGCRKQPRSDDGARTLTPRLAAQGVVRRGDHRQAEAPAAATTTVTASEGALRFYLAVIAVLGVFAAYGIGARLASPLAGLVGVVVLLSFPLMVLQARQLTSEVGTAAGATLLIYGLVALSHPARWPLTLLDAPVALAALVVGAPLAFLGGGALLGLLPALGAVAVAGGLGLVLFPAGARLALHGLIHALPLRHRIGREPPLAQVAGLDAARGLVAILSLAAFAAAAVVAIVLAIDVYDVQERAPGTREILGHSFVATECWADSLGGVWRSHDDVKSTYDSMFEQAAFGMFPWGVLAPVAMAGLALGFGGDDRRHLGRLTLAWATLAWIAGTVFQRKVGATTFAGFPACAIAIGAWLDAFWGRRIAHDAGRGDAADGRRLQAAGLLVGLWVLLGMITIAKDLQAFPDRMTSLLVGGDQIKYPQVELFGIKLRAYLLVIAVLTGMAFALGAWLWWPRSSPRWRWLNPIGSAFVAIALVWTLVAGLFWAQVWQPQLSTSLSSKHVFSVYRELRQDGDVLGVMGDMGNAPRYYADGPWEELRDRGRLIEFLGRDERVFALAPAGELCAIHRAFAGAPYHVLDDSNARFLLLSNQLGNAVDRNPLSTTILRTEPDGIATRFAASFDDKIELVGFTMPPRVPLRGRFKMTLYFHVKAPVSGQWKIFAHFDGRGARFQGDHEPIRGRCATSFWQAGDFIVDTFEVDAGDLTFEAGNYQVRVGFFTGTNPNWKNMKVTSAPAGTKDDADRVLIGSIRVD